MSLSTSYLTAIFTLSSVEPVPARTRHLVRIDLSNLKDERGVPCRFSSVRTLLDISSIGSSIICRQIDAEPLPLEGEEERLNTIRVLALEIENTSNADIALEDVKLNLLGIPAAPRPATVVSPALEVLTPSALFEVLNDLTPMTCSSVETTVAGGEGGGGGGAGDNGWSPIWAIVPDGPNREVVQLQNWQGGTGSKPPFGSYLGAAGLVPNIADARNIRGKDGADGRLSPFMLSKTINVQGNVTLNESDLAPDLLVTGVIPTDTFITVPVLTNAYVIEVQNGTSGAGSLYVKKAGSPSSVLVPPGQLARVRIHS